MRTLTSPLQAARMALWNDRAWLWFVQIEVSGGRHFRLVRNTRHVEANGVVWQAASFELDVPADDGSGAMGRMGVRIADASRSAIAYAEVDGEFFGQPCTVFLAHESALSAFEPDLSWSHTILSVTVTEKVFALECAHPSETQRVPGPVMDRRRFPQLLPAAGVQIFRS